MSINPRQYKLLLIVFALLMGQLGLFQQNLSAHENNSGGAVSGKAIEAHRRIDFGFPGMEQLNRKLQSDYKKFDNAVNTKALRPYWQPSLAPDSYLYGEWSPVYNWPLVAIHAMLLPNGKVLSWDSVRDTPAETYSDHNRTRAVLWDPLTNVVTQVDNTTTGYNVFCAGHSLLPDGRPLLAGGNLNANLDGTNTTHFFNAANNSWSLGPFMLGGRWYPSTTPLANGEVLITSGGPHTPEVFTTAGTLRALSGATLSMPLYPWLEAAPNGKAFFFGPNNTLQYLNTGGVGLWENLGGRDGLNRDYGSFAMYDTGKILAAGGGSSVKSSVTIDINNGVPQVTASGNMTFGRRQHNLVILPDGSVIAFGGNSSGASLVDLANGVYAPELWNPATGAWRTLSVMQRTRQYHSTALLLPDGRVLVGGGGICGTCHQVGYLEKNVEIFTPPYLFNPDGSGALAARPSIAAVPAVAGYNGQLTIDTPDAASISSVALIRLPSVTHSVDFDQRRVPLTFTAQAAGSLIADTPASTNLAPPGYYMLFIINNQGVPSEAKIVQFTAPIDAPTLNTAQAGNGSVALNWTPVNGATDYTVKYGTASGNYTTQVSVGNVTNFTVTGLINGATYYFVVTATGAGGSGPDSNQLSATPFPLVIGTGTGLTGTYFNNSNLTAQVLTRTDATVNFNWGTGSPNAAIGVETFSTVWSGQVQAKVSGPNTFYTTSDDGVRLWVNNQLLIDKWINQAATEYSGTIILTAGTKYDIRLEYYENTGNAVAQLRWAGPGVSKEVIPTTQLYPTSDLFTGIGVGLAGTYFDNSNFTAQMLTRIDPTVNFNWGTGSPTVSLGADTFSVRWTGQVQPQVSGTHTFYTTSDDGVRLWVNNQLLIDKWINQAATEYSGTIILAAGVRYDIRMEYYENTGNAVAQLRWSAVGVNKEVIPATQLYVP